MTEPPVPPESPPQQKALYVMIGGFLGAGKTTAIDRFATAMVDRGLRVGLITNDQSTGLVDTAILRSRGHAVEEITGGCFCCRFDSLSQAASALDKLTRPEMFLAEPVGSCTDLVATVSYPLRRIYGDRFRIAPLSVLVDPVRARRILGLESGKRPFSPKVTYVYRKQLEEADLLVVNKCDNLADEHRAELVTALQSEFPGTEVLCISAKSGDGLDAWFERVLSGEGACAATMELDYDEYAEGEALLGWLNSTIEVKAPEPFDGNAMLLRLAADMREQVAAAGGEVAHLKMTLDCSGQLSVVSCVGNHDEPDLRESLLDLVPGGALVVNLRAELCPENLSAIVAQALVTENALGSGAQLTSEHEERFRPARPTPTHRVSVSDPSADS